MLEPSVHFPPPTNVPAAEFERPAGPTSAAKAAVAQLRLRRMPQSRLRALCAASLSDRIRLIDRIDKSALEPLVREVETVQNKREQACSNSITEEKTALALEIDLGLEAIAAGISSVPAEDRSLSIGSLLRSVCSVLSREKVARCSAPNGSMALLSAVIA